MVEEASLAEQSLRSPPTCRSGRSSSAAAVAPTSARSRRSAARPGVLAVVWIDAHGDLNTPQSSPSGNAWGMPLRMLLDGGAVEPGDVALVGARNLDPEVEFIEASGLHTGPTAVERALAGAESVYVALDADSAEPGDLAAFMPEPDGLRLDELEAAPAGRRSTRTRGRTRLHRPPARARQRAVARSPPLSGCNPRRRAQV